MRNQYITMNKLDIDTPALVVNFDVMMRNIREMAKLAKESGVKLRAHVKTHKVPEIAKLQLEEGSKGICVQKLGEAEVMANHGIDDIFITNEIVGEKKIKRLADLAEKIKIYVAVDHPENVISLSQSMKERGVELGVYIDVDCGMHRTGVSPEKAPELASLIHRSEGLYFAGVMGYEGHAGAPLKADERQKLTEEAIQMTLEAVRLIKNRGIEVKEVSVGSTPTVAYSSKFEEVTEIQPGTYVFNDYYLVDRAVATIETCALRVLATVMSRSAPDRGVIDAGSKAFQLDMNRYPVATGIQGVEVIKFSEEHGWLKITGEAQNKIKLGDKLEFIPYHVCTCVNQHDTMYITRNDKVIYEWQIKARGKMV
ncbi:MAG: DSD1 family PLP-dependent enzyme [Nitrososphaerota archaeon]